MAAKRKARAPQGNWAWTGSGIEVFVPDVRINPKKDKASYFAVPMRGWSHTMAVYDTTTKKMVGWVDISDLGYDSVKAYVASPDFNRTPVAKFVA
jgi:hypothetical protein